MPLLPLQGLHLELRLAVLQALWWWAWLQRLGGGAGATGAGAPAAPETEEELEALYRPGAKAAAAAT